MTIDLPKNELHIVCHFVLLLQAAVVLNGEDQWEVRDMEGIFEYRIFHHLFEQNFGHKRPAMVNDGLSILTIPAVNWKEKEIKFSTNWASI